MYTTYILYSHSTKRFYSGQCENPGIRLAQHNSGRNKSTKFGIPWTLVYSENHQTRSAAILLENTIKKRGAKRFLLDHDIQIG